MRLPAFLTRAGRFMARTHLACLYYAWLGYSWNLAWVKSEQKP